MAPRSSYFGLFLLALPVTGCTSKSDAARGGAIFRERCAVCHASASGEGGGQGPGLANVLGRKAGTAPGFAYSSAMRGAGLTWEKATLDRFLAAPSELVPATTMPIATPNADDRRALIAFLGTLDSVGSALGMGSPRSGDGGASAGGDYRSDRPGARRHITVGTLPAPFASPSVRNAPSVIARPAGASPAVLPGFMVDLFAQDLTDPRAMRLAPNGDVFLSETAAGRVRVLRAKDGAKTVEANEVFASGLDEPFGIAFFPPGPEPKWVYVANTNAVVRFAYANGDVHARGAAEVIIPRLAGTGGHSTRDVAFSPDGGRMFVSVGSDSNVAEGMPLRPPVAAPAWEQSHGLGAAWGDEEWRADVLAFTPDGKNRQTFAAGIRNCVGLAVCPETGDLWCSTNERDGLGDDLVPDYITRIRGGAFYGWPWLYLGDHVDPRHPAERADLVGKVTLPDVLLQAHSASLEMVFYEGAMFPSEFHGNAFAAFHGSWNRSVRTGPKVVRVLIHGGVPTGEYEDFMTGFVADEAHVWGRPVGVTVARDGALLVSEDANGTVWRVSRP